MDTFDPIAQAVRAAINAHYPKAWERAQAGHEAVSVTLLLASADVGAKANRKLLAEAIEGLDFPPAGPAIFQIRRISELQFLLTAWRSR